MVESLMPMTGSSACVALIVMGMLVLQSERFLLKSARWPDWVGSVSPHMIVFDVPSVTSLKRTQAVQRWNKPGADAASPQLFPWQHGLVSLGVVVGQKLQLSTCTGPIEPAYHRP